MKTTVLLISSLVILASCNEGVEQDRDQAKSNLKNYVDSVETAVSATAEHNWDALDRRYNDLESRADKAFANASDEMKADLDRIEDRYENTKEDYKARQAEFKQKADEQMAEVEAWFNRTTEKTGDKLDEMGDDINDGIKESMDWLQDNYEKLEDNTQRKFDELKEKANKEEA